MHTNLGRGLGGHTRRYSLPAAIIGLVVLICLSACAPLLGSGSASSVLVGHIQVDGSTALQPLVTAAATLFDRQYSQVHIIVSGGGSVTGLNDVNSRKVDIGDSDIYADPATYPDPDLTDHLVCVIPFTMILSSDVPLKNLSSSDIINIFATGKYTNWDQIPGLNGPDLPIVPIVRSPTSGTRATFRRYVLGGRDELASLKTISSSQDVLKAVASTPGAIGYLAASVLNANVHSIAIDGYTATLQNIDAGHYSFWSYEHMYTLNITGSSVVSAFLNFMLTAQIQQQAVMLNYIPISNLKFTQLSSVGPIIALRASAYLAQSKEVFV